MDDSQEEWFRDAVEEWTTRRENPYVISLVEALLPYGVQGLPRRRAIDLVERLRRAKGLQIPPKIEEVIQSAFNQHCLGSAVYQKLCKPGEALFSSRRDGNSAIWVVDADRAEEWLKARKHHAIEVV